MALRDINLVPWDVLQKNTQWRHIRFWITCLVGLIFLLGVGYGAQYHRMEILKKQGPSLGMAGRDQVASTVAALSILQDQIQALQAKNQSLAILARGQLSFDIMGRFSNCLNDQTWITSLSIKQTSKLSDGAVLECQGVSWDHHSLGLFLNSLSNTPGIQQVVLGNAHNTDTETSAATAVNTEFTGSVRFDVSAIIVRSSVHDPSN